MHAFAEQREPEQDFPSATYCTNIHGDAAHPLIFCLQGTKSGHTSTIDKNSHGKFRLSPSPAPCVASNGCSWWLCTQPMCELLTGVLQASSGRRKASYFPLKLESTAQSLVDHRRRAVLFTALGQWEEAKGQQLRGTRELQLQENQHGKGTSSRTTWSAQFCVCELFPEPQLSSGCGCPPWISVLHPSGCTAAPPAAPGAPSSPASATWLTGKVLLAAQCSSFGERKHGKEKEPYRIADNSLLNRKGRTLILCAVNREMSVLQSIPFPQWFSLL